MSEQHRPAPAELRSRDGSADIGRHRPAPSGRWLPPPPSRPGRGPASAWVRSDTALRTVSKAVQTLSFGSLSFDWPACWAAASEDLDDALISAQIERATATTAISTASGATHLCHVDSARHGVRDTDVSSARRAFIRSWFRGPVFGGIRHEADYNGSLAPPESAPSTPHGDHFNVRFCVRSWTTPAPAPRPTAPVRRRASAR